ncbi:uncharacterized protein BT62DRAFT_936449 [Guyanagaster necrorhizus]|uniref:Uncharacterized protein n=1 Tax=Guyanagaster necrorhizus TaxID=856835 RepID=A0A9P7VLG9_9AGAR|nr:uncharacterized protein BT62DRAFT_936449 [Guyanagaster necrorhizus MCA 3950]KAG7442094.1 hypothetical protein BT62DRAFT_936449 [Guyanagaster necrorhizus MCA 3950]
MRLTLALPVLFAFVSAFVTASPVVKERVAVPGAPGWKRVITPPSPAPGWRRTEVDRAVSPPNPAPGW